MEQRVAAGIVIYHPNVARLIQCLTSVINDVDKIYIFKNDNTNIDFFSDPKIHILAEAKNLGLSHALNLIMREAQKDGFQWVVTLDQDSILPPGMIAAFTEHFKPGVGIICPQVIDKRRAYMQPDLTNEPVTEVSEAITSASCTSVSAWQKVGKFDEWLFIDLIDNEFSKRLKINGFKILRLNKWILDQQFGDIVPKSARSQKFWLSIAKLFNNNNFAKFSYRKHVDPKRVYYTNRNIIYVNRKLKLYGPVAYQNYNSKSYTGFIIAFMIPSILRAKKKREAVKATVEGIRDGIKAKVVTYKV
ncbi:glycosyltransferase [Lacticaseibacillus paracasei]|uniref:Glycosyltransferase n=1 Tax=Lacticaseibacillus paracasei TaxID=1597 RepID=A0AAW6AB86_LACPA|nr:glycosyltransferase [Lacticaseibacillus paracasei]MDB1565702.1 glycosyltransferase [Lacticaseibacillus paracasei]